MKYASARDRIEEIILSTIRDTKDADAKTIIRTVQAASASCIEALESELPPYVDIEGRFETKPGGGVYVKLYEHPEKTDLDEKMDLDQMEYLANYADAEGYNRAIWATRNHLKSLYMAK